VGGCPTRDRVAADKGDKESPAGFQHPLGFHQCLLSVGLLQQVVKRPHKQHTVERVAGEAGEVGGCALLKAGQRHASVGNLLSCQPETFGREVKEGDFVTPAGQFDSVAAGAAAAVQHPRRRWREVLGQRSKGHGELGAMIIHTRPFSPGLLVVSAFDVPTCRVSVLCWQLGPPANVS